MPNRLHAESSPYLKQHQNNPVDWYPWGEEALARARAEDKPILLSIGYSACHWCHVMEHESFENPQIAALMNERFINIKVDREERPDLDQIYQNVSQLMTRSGGWPLTVFLTPDLKPFFGGTYFPPEDRYGRPGFSRVLAALSEAYQNDRASVADNAHRLTEAIGQLESPQPSENRRPDHGALRKVCDAILGGFDWHNGGFGGAPKFPNTMNLTYLWRFGWASGFGMAEEAVVAALNKMARGGIYDQLGGGFHRYSVDERWSVPHFEKMLYDNALLMKLYSEVLLTAKDLRAEDKKNFLRVLSETVTYVLREMKAPEGGFYSTQDADTEGHEGKFFVWSPKEIRSVLSEDEARVFELHYGVSESGNFENSGQTVLHVDRSIEDIARLNSRQPADVESLLQSGRAKLLAARNGRVHPGRDEKIIASWNGLMISALCWASRALRENGFGEVGEAALESALVAMDFVRGKMTHGGTRIFSVYKDGQSRLNGYLDDYAFCAMAALDLARVVSDKSEIEALTQQAKLWIDVVRERFADKAGGGFYFTSNDHEKLIHRPKSVFDQAIPSGNAVMIECLTALAELLGDAAYESEADEHLYRFFPTVEKIPLGLGEMACAALLYVFGPVTVSGFEAHKACRHPHVFQKAHQKTDFAATGGPVSHEILVCHRKTCDLPLTDPSDAAKLALKKVMAA